MCFADLFMGSVWYVKTCIFQLLDFIIIHAPCCFIFSEHTHFPFHLWKLIVFCCFADLFMGTYPLLCGLLAHPFQVCQNHHFSTIRFYNNLRPLLFYIFRTYLSCISPVETNTFLLFCECIFRYCMVCQTFILGFIKTCIFQLSDFIIIRAPGCFIFLKHTLPTFHLWKLIVFCCFADLFMGTYPLLCGLLAHPFQVCQNYHFSAIRFYNNLRALLFYIFQTYSCPFSPVETNTFFMFCECIFGYCMVCQNHHFLTITFYNNSRVPLFYIFQTYSFPFSPVETNSFLLFCESIYGYMPLTVWSSGPSFWGLLKSPFPNY